MRIFQAETESEKDEVIRQLKEDLWMLRYSVLHLLPYEIGQILDSYRQCSSRRETYRWIDNVAEKIVEYAQPLDSHMSGWGSRANCPLCDQGADSPYRDGFALPEGLRRHLVGYGNTHQCLFTDVAQRLAREHWNDKFTETEKIEWQEKQEELARRRQSETIYQISPFDGGELLDEGVGFGEESRSLDALTWAESRLAALGLEKNVEGNIQSWVDDRESWIVYADIRSSGRIRFSVWKKPLPKRRPTSTYRYKISEFYLLDTWKNDLKSKYESRLPVQK